MIWFKLCELNVFCLRQTSGVCGQQASCIPLLTYFKETNGSCLGQEVDSPIQLSAQFSFKLFVTARVCKAADLSVIILYPEEK